jgi:CRISPR-associated exonuclease Cas4
MARGGCATRRSYPDHYFPCVPGALDGPTIDMGPLDGTVLIGGSVIVTLLATLFWYWSKRRADTLNLPEGTVIFADSGTWYGQEEPLYSSQLRLVGKPDFLVEQYDGTIIPVEVKSGNAPADLYSNHIMQLGAYCILVDEVYGIRPTHGILQYRDRAFAVDFTIELEDEIYDVIDLMRDEMFEPELSRDHEDRFRCAGCSMHYICDESLA